MGAMREAWNRVLLFVHKPERDAEMEAELAAHVELAVLPDHAELHIPSRCAQRHANANLLRPLGMVVGLAASFAASRLIAALLFRTASTDPVTFVATILLLGSVALVAGYLPARRASRINPMIALRNN